MKILHISSAKTWRGGERQVNLLMNGLKNKGVECALMTPKNSVLSSRCGLESSKIIEFKKGAFSLLQNIRSLKKYCNENQVDIIHGHDSHAHTLLWLAYRMVGLKTKSLITRRLMNPIKNRSLKKYNYPRIEKIICISSAVKEVLAPSISDQSRLEVIHSAIEASPNSFNKPQPKSNNEFVIGYVAAFTEEKDHQTFVATAEYLVKNYTDHSFRFLLVGDGPLLEEIKNQTERISENFTFSGFVESVDEAYLEMNLLLHTSRSEALGTALLDAMKYGIPVVASNTGGIPEIIDHSQNGFLCESGNFKDMAKKIFALVCDPELRQKFTENALVKLQHFDKSIMIDKTLVLYQDMYNADK